LSLIDRGQLLLFAAIGFIEFWCQITARTERISLVILCWNSSILWLLHYAYDFAFGEQPNLEKFWQNKFWLCKGTYTHVALYNFLFYFAFV